MEPDPSDPTPTPRDRLLVAAIDYVAEHGISDLSLRSLAAGLGTSHRMLIHHFGSKAGLRAAIVSEVERRQRDALADLDAGGERSLAELGRAMWQRLTDPAVAPYERLFFELYAQALHGRDAALSPGPDLIEPWLGPLTELYEARGVPRARARTLARLGLATTRGLLLDLLATGDRKAVDDCMELLIELGPDAGDAPGHGHGHAPTR